MKGKIFGGILLLTGSCVGAGMLGLPILTGMAGFFPTLVMFFLAWFFMTTTALLLVEVNCWFKRPVNLLSMVEHSLGKYGRAIAWALYLFLFYALLVAYMVLSGNHFASLFQNSIPSWVGTFFFVAGFGWLIYLGTRPVDLVNRLLMFGKIAAFLGLVFLGFQYVQTSNLVYSEPSMVFIALPILIISFGFHNMIPTLSAYLDGDVKRIKKAIIGGSLLTLAIYLVWEVVAIGILPTKMIFSAFRQDIDAAGAIQDFLHRPVVGSFSSALAFFAILTSFLAQSLGLSHFWRDGLSKLKKSPNAKLENFWYCGLTLLPPLGFAILYSNIFFAAINFAGGICAVILFGLFPALMVWKGRARANATYKVWGGRPLLIFIALFSCFILFYQLSQMVGLNFFPSP
ncbi:MAG: tyrosine transporter [Chlamydiia bacterium]|nr:tyrosine transporter [Chlamydiia bacterium]